MPKTQSQDLAPQDVSHLSYINEMVKEKVDVFRVVRIGFCVEQMIGMVIRVGHA